MDYFGSRRILIVALLGLATALPEARGAAAQTQAAEFRPDPLPARKEIHALEAVINGVVRASFNAAPFALTQRTKGVYLPGYGMAFSFVVNIHRALINTPFGEVRRAEITPEEKKKRIEDVKERLMRVLFENGDQLHQLRREETVAIVAFFEDRNFPDEESQNRTVVLSVARRDLEGMGSRAERWGEFKPRIRILEY